MALEIEKAIDLIKVESKKEYEIDFSVDERNIVTFYFRKEVNGKRAYSSQRTTLDIIKVFTKKDAVDVMKDVYSSFKELEKI